MEGNQFRCTGTWNGEEFDRVIEAENEVDCHIHFMFWSSMPGVKLENLQIEPVAN